MSSMEEDFMRWNSDGYDEQYQKVNNKRDKVTRQDEINFYSKLYGLLGSLKIVDCIFDQMIKAEKGEESSVIPFKDNLSLLEYFKAMNQINLDYLKGILGDE